MHIKNSSSTIKRLLIYITYDLDSRLFNGGIGPVIKINKWSQWVRDVKF